MSQLSGSAIRRRTLSLSLPSFLSEYLQTSWLKKLREPKRQGEKNKKGKEQKKRKKKKKRKKALEDCRGKIWTAGRRRKSRGWRLSVRKTTVANLRSAEPRRGKSGGVRWNTKEETSSALTNGTSGIPPPPPINFPPLCLLPFLLLLLVCCRGTTRRGVLDSVYLGTSRIRAIDDSRCGVRLLTAVLFTVFHREILEKSAEDGLWRGDKARCITFEDLAREKRLLEELAIRGDGYFLPFVATFEMEGRVKEKTTPTTWNSRSIVDS